MLKQSLPTQPPRLHNDPQYQAMVPHSQRPFVHDPGGNTFVPSTEDNNTSTPPMASTSSWTTCRCSMNVPATLIPKRIFLTVLMTPGATVDGVHLSPKGHEMMRDAVWELVEAAYR